MARTKCGQAQYHCKACGAYRVLEPVPAYSEAMKRTILNTYKERASLRGLQRIFGVARRTVLRWLKTRGQQLPDLKDTLTPPQADDVLELDELWSFVFKKDAKRWLWLALCRRTRQIVAFVIGDRRDATCRRLWNKIPAAYRACHSFSDFWAAYQKVFATATHQAVGTERGETAHIERCGSCVFSFGVVGGFHGILLSAQQLRARKNIISRTESERPERSSGLFAA
jgi:IS1 family transposase